MASKQAEALGASQGRKARPLPEFPENHAAKKTGFWKEFAFGVKLFGIAALVVLLLWVLNRSV